MPFFALCARGSPGLHASSAQVVVCGFTLLPGHAWEHRAQVRAERLRCDACVKTKTGSGPLCWSSGTRRVRRQRMLAASSTCQWPRQATALRQPPGCSLAARSLLVAPCDSFVATRQRVGRSEICESALAHGLSWGEWRARARAFLQLIAAAAVTPRGPRVAHGRHAPRMAATAKPRPGRPTVTLV